ncbi:MAG TPA: gamma-glutamyltransferase [Aggregatilineales bacterium]|nr:gamma-glutamyltransferase [Aggregatilineales bacterium]
MNFTSNRSMAVTRRGMVATSNVLAAQSGLAALRQGGNAADAAVATAAVLNVTEPASTGVGGDCFALYYDARTKQVTALNGSGRSPAALNLGVLAGHEAIHPHGPHAVTVPGTVAGWADLLARHGTLTLADALADAIHYARDGFPVAPLFGLSWARSEVLLRNSPNTEDYLPGGSAPKIGQIVRLPGLATTLQAIADGGADAFYSGPIAQAIVTTLASLGGVMTLDDLKNHHSTWETPIATDYRGVRVYECPPNGQGLATLQALNIASGWDLAALRWDSPERLHLLVEAMRLAFADARQYIADNATNPAPLDFLLSRAYADERRALIRDDRAIKPPSFGVPIPGSDTVYLTTADGAGNACSFINSLYMGFGTGIVAKGTGVFLQNRGALFSLQPGHPNCLAPSKRPYHTIIPGMALRDGELYSSFGVMGGFMQPQGHLQVLTAMIDDGADPQEALDRPRFCLVEGTGDSILAVEEGIPIATMARLADMGHRVQPVSGTGRNVFGGGQIINRDSSGVLYGGSDPRKDGHAAGF